MSNVHNNWQLWAIHKLLWFFKKLIIVTQKPSQRQIYDTLWTWKCRRNTSKQKLSSSTPLTSSLFHPPNVPVLAKLNKWTQKIFCIHVSELVIKPLCLDASTWLFYLAHMIEFTFTSAHWCFPPPLFHSLPAGWASSHFHPPEAVHIRLAAISKRVCVWQRSLCWPTAPALFASEELNLLEKGAYTPAHIQTPSGAD